MTMTPPGDTVENEELVNKALDRIARTWRDHGTELGSEVFDFLDRQTDEAYFLSYEHPILPGRNWLRKASGREAREFLRATIDPERGEGLDLLVAPEDLRFVIIINHDGEAVLVPS